MVDAQPIIDGVLHFIKGAGPHVFSDYLRQLTKNHTKWCPFQVPKGQSVSSCYETDEKIEYLLKLFNRYVAVIDFVENTNQFSTVLLSEIESLKNLYKTSGDLEDFQNHLNNIVSGIFEEEESIYKKLRTRLTCLECHRLDEAILCLESNCYTAATIMAVTAVEARLHHLIQKRNRKIYKARFERATLGKLISLFDASQFTKPPFKALKNLLPEKHRPLLDLLNVYRIFSAHPKVTTIERKIAVAIINLSFVFLFDSHVGITDQKLLMHH